MKVLTLSDYYPPNTRGGADIAAERLSAELARQGHSVSVLTTVADKSQAVSDTVRGVQVRRIVSHYPAKLRNYMAVYNPMVLGNVADKIAEFRPDVVHAHNIHTHLSFHTLLVARRAGMPVVLTAHDHQLFCCGKFDCSDPSKAVKVPASQCARCQRLRYFPLRNRLIQRALRRSGARVLAVSNALRDDLVANGTDPAVVGVVHNGIDPASMEVSPEHVQGFARRHALEGKKVVLFGGRVSHAKGIDQAVAALGKLPRDLNFVFMVLGSSEDYVSYILQLGHRLSVEDRTVFLPWMSGEDLKAAFSLSSVCLTPSLYREPFNLINIEAMALRKPVITTCFGGPPEVVVDGVTGYVLDPRDVDKMSARLLELLTDDAKARSMGEAGYARVAENFTVGHQAGKVLAAYEEALSRRS
ncbi:MAG: glycosyltransferase family 4 protein [Chloroflexi bacterium]|nr:glycosyltransferase family 4 protein [Chloroflexota bacterium]MCL5026167.1 glycosyltransferase family 4 protein [Chloroflexota bacterium]